ncbi:MAG TPA: efflux RND transporter permease subunit [Polyangiaceae bacterium]|nr:efflux RND transporter permease subunit [Polyangiaceae bacterium]
MQWLAQLCVRRPVFATVLMLVIVVLGAVGYTRLGVDQFPNVDVPFVIVTTRLDGASPEEVETDISDKIEGAVNTIDGIDELQSVSTEGFSQVRIAFKIEKSSDEAANDVRDKVNNVLRDLPRGIDPPKVTKVDPQSSPVLLIALRSSLPARDVTELADKSVRRQIESVSGVGQVTMVGGRARQVHVWLDPLKLRALNLSAVDVQRALAAQNLTTPGGRIETGPQALTLRVAGRVESVEGIGRIVLREDQGHAVRIADVARVEDGEEELRSLASYDGERTVMLSVRKQSGTNTVEVVDQVRARLAEVKRALPPGVELEIVRDNSAPIRTSVGAVKEHLVLGALLAALVVLVFLGNARSTFIAAVAIPISIVGTFALMWLQGFSLNMMTLLALALAVGIVIDDAIVVLENIVRFVQEKGVKPFPAAVLATREIGLAVLATTLSLMAVFVPVAFVGGIPGRFLKNFGYTMAFAVGVSLLVSFSLTPALSARALRLGGGHGGGRLERVVDLFYRPIERAYMRLLEAAMRRRWAVLLLCAAALGSCGPIAKRVPGGFLPVDDQAQFEISVRTPEGTSVEETALVAERVAQDARRLPGVAHTVVTVAGGDDQTTNLASVYVALVDPAARDITQQQLMDRARKEILAKLPAELRTSVSEVAAFATGASNAAVQYVMVGPDLKRLEELTAKMAPRIKADPAVVDFDTSLITGKPEVRVAVDRDRAADLGVSVADVAETLLAQIGGVKASTYSERGEEYEVRLRADASFRRDVSALSLLTVPSRKFGTVPLSSVVNVTEGSGPSQINRLGRQRQVTFMANVTPGMGESDVTKAIKDAFAAADPPPEYRLQPTGRSKTSSQLAAGFALAFGLSFVFMYLILAAQFESWLYPLIILLSLPLTVPFALLSLLIFGQGLNLMSALGVLVLFGVVKKNSILQIDHTNHLRALGRPRLEAILEANRDRLRPILMTTIAFVAGMLPLALSRGVGSGNNRNISGIVIGGQTFSLLLTLLATPVAYSLFDDAREWLARRRRARAKADGAADRGEAELEAIVRGAPPPPSARRPAAQPAE